MADISEKIKIYEPSTIVTEFTETIKNIAVSSNIRTKNTVSRNRHRHHVPWFDPECQRLKNKILLIGKQLRKFKNDATIRENLFLEKCKLNKLVRNKKFVYKKSIIDQINTNNQNPKQFWKLLDKLSTNTNIRKTSIKSEDWVNYFKSQNKVEEKYPKDYSVNGPLDYTWTTVYLDATQITLSTKL